MTYPKLPCLTWDGTIYENEEMGTLEAVSYTHLKTLGIPVPALPHFAAAIPD